MVDIEVGEFTGRPLPGAPAVTGLRIVGHPVSFDGTTLTGLPGDLTLV